MTGKIVLNRAFTDMLKLFAALCVAVGHYSGYAVSHGHSNIIYSVIVATGGCIGVAIFFFLSGYGLMMSEKKHHTPILTFLKRRFLKVYIPVVFVSAIWGLVRWPEGAGFEWIGKYLGIVFWNFGDGILWFIRVIILEYILFAAFSFFEKRTWIKYSILIVGTALIYAWTFIHVGDWAAISVPMFAIGIMLAKYEEWFFSLLHSWRLAVWLLLISAGMGVLYYLYGNTYAHALINYYFVTAIMATSAYNITSIITPPNVPHWAGTLSYDIYLTHYKVIYYCSAIYGFIGLHHFIIGVLILSTASFTLRKLLKIG